MNALLALLLLAAPVRAVQVTATVNKDSVLLSDQIYLTVTVSGASMLSKPQLPSMPHFNIYDAGESTSMSFINGQMSSEARYSFVLAPRAIGDTQIPPIVVEADGQTAQTPAIPIRILRPDASPPPGRPQAAAGGTPAKPRPAQPQAAGPDLFVEAEVDNKEPFVNEQVLLSVRFYTAVPLAGQAQWDQPDVHGFLSESLPPSPHRQIQKNGRVYFLSEVKMALYPLKAGALTIGESLVTCQVRERMAADPFAPDFLQQFFSGGLMPARARELRTDKIPVKVRDLPADGKPAEFNGAVGRFKIRADTDGQNFEVGDAINLSVTIEGTGNLKGLPELKLPEMSEFRVYDTVTDLSLDKGEGGISGRRVYKTVLVPRVSGDLTIPALPFAFFDPKTKRYESLKTRPLSVTVKPGKGGNAAVGYQSQGPGAEITQVTADIRHIKRRMDAPLFAGFVSAMSRALWLHAVPSLIFTASLGMSLWRRRELSDPGRLRLKKSRAFALARVKEARSAESAAKAAGLLHEALANYLSAKMGRPAAGLTLRDAQEALGKRLPPGHLAHLKTVWEELDFARFAPAGASEGQAGALCEQVAELIAAFEEGLK